MAEVDHFRNSNKRKRHTIQSDTPSASDSFSPPIVEESKPEREKEASKRAAAHPSPKSLPLTPPSKPPIAPLFATNAHEMVTEIKEVQGLILHQNFLTPSEQRRVLEFINHQPWSDALPRLTQHYGFEYKYSGSSWPE